MRPRKPPQHTTIYYVWRVWRNDHEKSTQKPVPGSPPGPAGGPEWRCAESLSRGTTSRDESRDNSGDAHCIGGTTACDAAGSTANLTGQDKHYHDYGSR